MNTTGRTGRTGRLLPLSAGSAYARADSITVYHFPLAYNLPVGYKNAVSTTEAAKELAKRSVRARRLKWGNEGFRKRMREWGKLGGRPSKKGNTQ